MSTFQQVPTPPGPRSTKYQQIFFMSSLDPDYQLATYDYFLPPELIAQYPAQRRDSSRLMVCDVPGSCREHTYFSELPRLFKPGDVLVLNNSRVFPARLLGKKESGGKIELFLLSYPVPLAKSDVSGEWQEAQAPALLKSSKRAKSGTLLYFGDRLQARVLSEDGTGRAIVLLQYHVRFGETLDDILLQHGQMPLPPYIQRDEQHADDLQRYQTCYARYTGSVAAPTAGLHFTDILLQTLRDTGVEILTVTLHVGYGTFAPVRTADIRAHRIHEEIVSLPSETAEKINIAKKKGQRIWAVGTTTTRTLEAAFNGQTGIVHPYAGPCSLYIYPGYLFKVVDNLITNFHLPSSSLLFLVAALAGRNTILNAYAEAVQHRYRFFSYGDAMALLTRP